MEKTNSDVLRRKLRTDPSSHRDQVVSPAKALRLGLARAADHAFKLALRVQGIHQSRLILSEVLDQIEEGWALFPLVHDDGSVGAICVNAACAIAFVEQQTSGRVAQTAPATRPLTRTDKALTQPLLEVFLRLFDDTLDGAPTAYWTRGYRCEDAADTRHLLALQLDAAEYRSFDIATEIVGSARVGQMRMFLPIKDAAGQVTKSKAVAGAAKGDDTGMRLRDTALEAQIEMRAVLCRITMSLRDLHGLEGGQLLQLPRDAMHKAILEDPGGRSAMPVHLGQLHGMRAVRLAVRADKAAQSAPVAPPLAVQEPPPKSKTPRQEDLPEALQETTSDAELDALLATP